jgi:hypothetical protein
MSKYRSTKKVKINNTVENGRDYEMTLDVAVVEGWTY